MSIEITSFYKFLPIGAEGVVAIKERLESEGARLGVRALIILAKEGVNGTFSATPESGALFIALLHELFGDELHCKRSEAPEHPFKKFVVKVRLEVCTTGRTSEGEVEHEQGKHGHVSAAEWHRALTSGEEITLLDTRNTYEVKIGKFRNAIDLGIENFSEFSAKLQAASLPKDRPVYMYCTGGIRCEKAILEAQRQGFQQISQLNDGILAYLEEFPNEQFEGECFVFDNRVAVDQHLRPSAQYEFCPHCGQPRVKGEGCDDGCQDVSSATD